MLNKVLKGLFTLATIIFSFSSDVVVWAADVTVNQSVSQSDPAYALPIVYTVVFSQSINVATFTATDFSTAGSTATGITINSITEVAPFDGTTFDVSVSMTGYGSVVLSIPASGTTQYAVATFGSVGSGPFGIAIDNSGNIYTANSTADADSITKITPAGVSTVFASLGTAPYGIVTDSFGNVYTANNNANNVSKITPAGVVTVHGTTGSGPQGITIDSSGNIYTSNAGSDNVSKITPAGVSTILGTTGFSPMDIAIDASGNVYTSNYFSNNVSKITPAGVSTILGTTDAGPYGIAIDSAGNVYTSNQTANTVTKITPAGVSATLGTIGDYSYDIAVDAFGNVFATNNHSDTVTKITPAGVLTTVGNTGLNPIGLVLDSVGNIYTANYGANSVSKFTVSTVDIIDLASYSNRASTSTDNSIAFAQPSVSDTITVNLPINATISITSPADVTMGAITGTGQSVLTTNQAEWITKTNNAAGYELSIQASSADMTNANLDTVAGYTPATPGTPEPWSIATTDSEWGMHYSFPQSTLGNDTVWGADDTYVDNWINVPTTPYVIETATAPTDIIGDSAVILFGAEVGSDKIQPTGTYSVDVTMTATTL